MNLLPFDNSGLSDLLPTRPRVVLTADNPFGIPAINGGDLATVTVSPSDSLISSNTNYTLLLLAGGLLALLLLKR